MAKVTTVTGTNHFQFRFHQFGLGVDGIGGGVSSTQALYAEHKLPGNESLPDVCA
jgi:hypothetical protein